MRLIELRTAYFRGFGSETAIPFDSDLVVFYGPNGTGKTTIAEAIEWLLFGQSQRQEFEKLEAYEKRGALRSVLCPEDESPFVEVDFELDDGTRRCVRRVMEFEGQNEIQRVYVDGSEVDDLSSLDLSGARRFYPVVVQENLQHFIRSSGQERRNQITKLLGLEALLEFDSVLDSVVRGLDSALPTEYEESKRELRTASERLRKLSLLGDLASRWRSGEAAAGDWQAVVSFCESELEAEGEPMDRLSEMAEQREKEARKAVVDISVFSPDDSDLSPEDDVAEVVRRIDALSAAIASEAQARSEAFDRLGRAVSTERLSWLGSGLEMLDSPQGEEIFHCPFCAEPTIDEDKYEHIEQRHSAGNDLLDARDQLDQEISKTKTAILSVGDRYLEVVPEKLSDSDRERLERLIDDDDAVASLASTLSEHRERSKEFGEITNQKVDFLDDLEALVEDPEGHEQVEKFLANTAAEIRQAAEDVRETLEELRGSLEHVEKKLKPVVSSDEKVRRLALVGRLLKLQAAIDRVSKAEELREFLKESRSSVRDYLDEQTVSRIDKRGSELANWFDVLYGNEEGVLEFGKVDPRRTVMRLWFDVLGESRHASTHLSQSQLNCLGLSLHVIAGTAAACPFRFVVFDDPIQSFDERLRGRFLGSAVDKLIGENDKQVIVLTHVEKFAKGLHYANAHRQPLVHRAREFSQTGIDLDLGSWVERALNDIRRRGRSSRDIERTVACHRMRPLGEQICKGIYRLRTQGPLPKEYEEVAGPNVVDLLESVGGISSDDLATLRELIAWAAGAGHEDPEWSPPDTQVIAMRADKLESIARKYGLPVN